MLTKDTMDFIITKKYEEFDTIKSLSKLKNGWSKELEYTIRQNLKLKTNVCMPDKLNLLSPNTSLISYYSDFQFVPGATICSFSSKGEIGKITTLYLNSIVCLIQFIEYKSETLGTYLRMTLEDWYQVQILDEEKLSESQKRTLLKLFEKLRNIEFPSLLEQFEKRFWARVELDKTILKVLGFSEKEIEEWLPKVYDAIVEELKSIKEVK